MPMPEIEPIPHQFDVVNYEALFAQPPLNSVSKKENTVKQDIASILKIPTTITPYPDELKKYKSVSDLDNTLLGIEVEVENIPNHIDFPKTWQMKQDGSLRNNGVEYVTYPTPARYVPSLFFDLQEGLKKENKPEYTQRTSVHVHMNVQDMTWEQVKSFVLLYLCFERVLFRYVGGNRDKSIFCVPLSHAGYVGTLKQFFTSSSDRNYIKAIANSWHKYTSLNLKTISGFGTIEFRHLYGTDDVDKLYGWLHLILAIKTIALTTSKERLFDTISELNSNSEYEVFASEVFKQHRHLLTDFLQDTMEDDVTHIKECFEDGAVNKFKRETFENSSFFKFHKYNIPVISDRQKELLTFTKEQLYEEMKRLAYLYQKASAKERSPLEKEYREVEKIYHKEVYKGEL